MNTRLLIPLHCSPDQLSKLVDLQLAFSAVCNALAPVAQRTQCWNRVALHHQTYRDMRQRFPQMGSQMICNAVYSVSRACRLVYQHPQSPFHPSKLAGKPLTLLRFLPDSPVYFDRHTLSLKEGKASLYTLDGRMRFNLPLAPVDEQRFREGRLREIVLLRHGEGFALSFWLDDNAEDANSVTRADGAAFSAKGEFPEYLLVIDEPQNIVPAQPASVSHLSAANPMPIHAVRR